MAHFNSLEQVIHALSEVGYSKEEIDHFIGEGWEEFDRRYEELGIDVSPSEYIMGLIRAKVPYACMGDSNNSGEVERTGYPE